jgi:hypothetical protein
MSSRAIAGAWQEAVVSVRDLDRWIEALDALFGWKVEWRGEADPALLRAWRLPAAARCEEVVLFHPDDLPRRVRLLRRRAAGGDPLEWPSLGHRRHLLAAAVRA